MQSVIYQVQTPKAGQLAMHAGQIGQWYAQRRLALDSPVRRKGMDDWSALALMAGELGIDLAAPATREAPVPVANNGLGPDDAAVLRSFPRSARLCTACGSIGEPRIGKRGSFGTEIFLWLFFLVPGICYSLWRFLGPVEHECRSCDNQTLIPLHSPQAPQVMRERGIDPREHIYTARPAKVLPVVLCVIGALFLIAACFVGWNQRGKLLILAAGICLSSAAFSASAK